MNPKQEAHEVLYKSLSELREHLHSTGRIDDSNAKLDELVKILAVCIACDRGWLQKAALDKLVSFGKNNGDTVHELKKLFGECVKLVQFKNDDGSSIFGANPSLNLQDSDNDYAFLLLVTVYTSLSKASGNGSNENAFDVVNEAFGHFVRDNFRGNIEDAQYMTPIEVVEFVCGWAMHDILKEQPSAFEDTFTVLDPSCGVGSFLAAFYASISQNNSDHTRNLNVVGVDKVDRMVRLSRINMMLFGSATYNIQQGNSLLQNDHLKSLNGKVDLILTNPPFGAKISTDKISEEPKDNYGLLNDADSLATTIDSELLFVDREISLLKDGGRLFIVVPDSTISSRGIAETLRKRLAGVAVLRGVIDLPSVTFAQAGTRTRTSILYLQKCKTVRKTDTAIMATVDSLGFQVSMRKGVAVKKYEGENDLLALLAQIRKTSTKKGVLSENPSCVRLRSSEVMSASWTASHYSARRIGAEEKLHAASGYKPRELREIVNFETKNRRRLKEEDGSKCISVLHIIGDGFISFADLLSYKPKTRGNVCYPGDILISKINPRIPRVLVIPEFDFPTTCSTEFEILTPKNGIDPYWVAYMLLEEVVQDQIQSLTSGTSSSHNRIKTQELETVKIPVPSTKKKESTTMKTVADYKRAISNIVTSSYEIVKIRGRARA